MFVKMRGFKFMVRSFPASGRMLLCLDVFEFPHSEIMDTVAKLRR